MRWPLALLLLWGCATPPKRELKPGAPDVAERTWGARVVAQSFVMAAEAGRFEEVHSLLCKPLRDRYSVEKLASDFGADPLAAARLTQIRLKSSAPMVETRDSASLEWASGRSLRLVREPEGFRICALE